MDNRQGISVGDATLQFLADTTNLDQGIESLNAKVESGMARAGVATVGFQEKLDSVGNTADDVADEVEEAGERSSRSMGEARGEVALLGEAFGVRLPRHVRSFVAELPGVGEALNAAFTATAILFVFDAIVKLTEKVTEFVSATFVYTQAMKDADAATASMNKTILDNEANIAKLNAAYDAMTMTPLQLLTKQLDEVNAKIATQKEEFDAARDELHAYRNGMDGVTEAQAKQAEQIVLTNKTVTESLVDQNRNLSTQIDKLYSDQATKSKELADKNLATFNELMFQQKQYAEQLVIDYNNLVDAITKLPTVSGDSFSKLTMDVGDVRDAMTKGQDAAKGLGIELKSDFEQNVKVAQRGLDEFAASGIKDDAALTQFQSKLKEAQKDLSDYGKEVQNVTRMQQLGTTAATEFGDKLATGFIAAATGAEGWGVAMQKATGQAISALGQYCQVQAMACLAKALSEWWDGAASGADFAAAAEYELAALACGVAGGLISGAAGGGAGGSSFQGTGRGNPNSPIQTTGGTTQSVAQTTNVQHLAGGGLVTSQTLAMIGDSASGGDASEAVIPLDNPEAMARFANALLPHLSGGAGAAHTFNATMFGNLSNSDLKRLMRQINKAVNQGTGTLHSTRTGRIVRRSP